MNNTKKVAYIYEKSIIKEGGGFGGYKTTTILFGYL